MNRRARSAPAGTRRIDCRATRNEFGGMDPESARGRPGRACREAAQEEDRCGKKAAGNPSSVRAETRARPSHCHLEVRRLALAGQGRFGGSRGRGQLSGGDRAGRQYKADICRNLSVTGRREGMSRPLLIFARSKRRSRGLTVSARPSADGRERSARWRDRGRRSAWACRRDRARGGSRPDLSTFWQELALRGRWTAWVVDTPQRCRPSGLIV